MRLSGSVSKYCRLALQCLLPALALPAVAAHAPARVPTQKYACSVGKEPHEMRFIIELAKEKPVFFALWTANRGYRCSVHATHGDVYSRWSESGGHTVIKMVDDMGTVTIGGAKGRYQIKFDDINKMRFCGMEGEMSGTVTLTRGHRECGWEGEPL